MLANMAGSILGASVIDSLAAGQRDGRANALVEPAQGLPLARLLLILQPKWVIRHIWSCSYFGAHLPAALRPGAAARLANSMHISTAIDRFGKEVYNMSLSSTNTRATRPPCRLSRVGASALASAWHRFQFLRGGMGTACRKEPRKHLQRQR